MKSIIITILYTIFHCLRNGRLPGQYAHFIIEQQLNEPWEHVFGNAWRWAEALPAPAEPTESAVEFTAIRWDADNGAHAQRIYETMLDSKWAYWTLEDDPFWDKVAMFAPTIDESPSVVEEDELPEWAYDLDDDECWF